MTTPYSRQEILKYGKANGYSDSQISQVMDINRNKIINYGINNGYKASQTNQVLNKYGYDNYNPLTARANWENLLPNFGRGAKEFARDMRTIGGQALKELADVTDAPVGKKLDAVKDKFIKIINNDKLKKAALGAGAGAVVGSALPVFGTLGGAITGGLAGMIGPKNITNAFLSPYEISTEDFGKKPLGDMVSNIVQGAMRNPFQSSVDALSFGGAKALGATGRAIGKAVPETAPLWVQEVFQSPAIRDFNRTGTLALQSSRAKNASLLEPLERLESTFGVNNEELVKNIILNEGNLQGKSLDIAKELKKSIKQGERKAVELGLIDKVASKNNVVAQYGMQKLKDIIPDILHNDLVKYIETGKLSERMGEAILNNPDIKTILDEVVNTGSKLYDEDNIAFLTQALTSTTDPRGIVTASPIAKVGEGYFGTNRIIGRADIPEMAKKLEDSIAFQQGQIYKAVQSFETLDDMLKRPGIAEIIKDANKVPEKGYKAINVDTIKNKLRDSIQSGTDIDMRRILDSSNLAEAGAYLVPNVYFEGLKNMLTPAGRGSGAELMNAFKKTVLANPHWVVLNRIGNWTNNSMGGVKLTDYMDAVQNKLLIPKQLKAQTSFNSYIGNNVTGFESSITQPLKKLASEVKRFSESDKGLKDIGRVASQVASNTSNVLSNPIFRFEAGAETIDRYANMIRQAKREAEATGKSWKQVLKDANEDQALFNKLNTAVNKDLGDYVGRNYLIPNEAYKLLGATIPFYRFLSQTGRTTLHQLANHPWEFQATVNIPARAGKNFSEEVIRNYGLDPETYEGGVPYKQQPDGTYRYIGIEPLPAGAVASDILSNSSKLGLIAPQWTLGGNIANYKKGEGWLPTSEGLTQYKLAKGTTKGYEPTEKERWGYGLSQLLNTFYAPVRMGRGFGRELVNTITGRPTLSNYDANIFDVNPLSYAREMPIETLGKWLGVQTRPYYPKRIERPRKPSKAQRRNMKIYNEQYNRNTKEGK